MLNETLPAISRGHCSRRNGHPELLISEHLVEKTTISQTNDLVEGSRWLYLQFRAVMPFVKAVCHFKNVLPGLAFPMAASVLSSLTFLLEVITQLIFAQVCRQFLQLISISVRILIRLLESFFCVLCCCTWNLVLPSGQSGKA
jgi:hypothetical protein